MILRRGTFFMRSMSASDSGCASGSASAAACRCSAVIPSRRLQSCLVFIVIPPPLARLRLPCRDNPNAPSPRGVDDEKQPFLNHADRHETLLGIPVAIVHPFDGKYVPEHSAR